MLIALPEADAAIALANFRIFWGLDCELHSTTMTVSMISLVFWYRSGSWLGHDVWVIE